MSYRVGPTRSVLRISEIGRWLAMILALTALSLAAVAAVPRVVQFDIPEGPAKEGLRRFARQAHVGLDLDPRQVERSRTRPVKGTFTLEEGLAILLRDSDIHVKWESSRTRIVVTPAEVKTPDKDTSTIQSMLKEPAVTHEVTPAEPVIGPILTVTGSRIPGNKAAASELITIDRPEIIASGVSNLGDLLRRLPEVFGGGPSQWSRGTDAESQSNTGLGVGVDLRGLGARATLVLIDGVRPAPSGNAGAFVDTLNIPVTAIDHIEILLDGASAIYGADAVGGVINVFTVGSDAPIETQVKGSGVTQGSLRQGRVGQILSGPWFGGDGVLVAELYRQTALNSLDRPFLSSDQRPYGGTNLDLPNSNPGTIVAGGTTYAIPHGAGMVTPLPLTPHTVNLTDTAQDAQVVPAQTFESLLGRFHKPLGDRLEVSLELMVAHREASLAHGGVQEALTVPRTNPFFRDPSGGAGPVVVNYDFADDLGPMTTRGDVLATLSAVHLERRIGKGFRMSVEWSHTAERERQLTRGDVNDTAVTDALALTDATQTLDVLGSGSHTNPHTLAGIERIPWYRSLSSYDTWGIQFDGPLGSWGAGPIKGAIGAEVRRQRFDTEWSDGTGTATATHFHRMMEAGFAELGVPIFSASDPTSRATQLDLSFATRFERYTDSIHATTPMVGIRWMPTHHIRFTGKFSKSFRVPDAGDVNTSANTALIVALPDEVAPGKFSTAVLASGSGNPTLKEEHAIARTAGVGISSNWADEAASRFELTYFDDEVYNRIQATSFLSPPQLLNVLNDPTLQYLIVRHPSTALRDEICLSGALGGGDRASCEAVETVVDLRSRNVQSLEARGLDLNAQLLWRPAWAHFQWSTRGVYFLNYDVINVPESPKASLLNTTGHPVDLTLQSTLRATRGGLSLAATVTYFNHYRNTNVSPNPPVASSTIVDLQLGHKWGADADVNDCGPWEVGIAIQNALNKWPPVARDPTQPIAYDPSNASPLGRALSLYLRWSSC